MAMTKTVGSEMTLSIEPKLNEEQFLQLVDDARLQLTKSFLAFSKSKMDETEIYLRKANDKVHALYNSLGENSETLKPEKKRHNPHAKRMSIKKAMVILGINYEKLFRDRRKDYHGRKHHQILDIYNIKELHEITVEGYKAAISKEGIHNSEKIDKAYEWLMDCFEKVRWPHREGD